MLILISMIINQEHQSCVGGNRGGRRKEIREDKNDWKMHTSQEIFSFIKTRTKEMIANYEPFY